MRARQKTVYSTNDKLRAVQRELNMRINHYPKWVAMGRMSQPKADMEIALFEQIADDYRALLAKEAPNMFAKR